MPAELLAAVAALAFATSHTLVKRGLVETTVLGGMLVQLSVACGVLAIATVAHPPEAVTGAAFGIFVAAGLLGWGAGTWASLSGISRLGPPVAIPIQQGTRPIVAVLAAVALLDERVSSWQGLGVVLIVAGGWRLSRTTAHAPVSPGSGRRRQRFLAPGVIFPIVAGSTFALGDVMVTGPLDTLSAPAFGAMVGAGAAAAAGAALVSVSATARRQVRIQRDAAWAAASGGFLGLAVLCLYAALADGDVTVVAPITSAQPLAVFLLSALFLRDLDPVTAPTVIAGLVVVAGAVLVAL